MMTKKANAKSLKLNSNYPFRLRSQSLGQIIFFAGRTLRSAVLLLAVLIPRMACSEKPSDRPNLIFIMADDLGWGDVGFHGGQASTPHLDQLADEGIELTNHYVAPVCSPTRTGLLTGRNWSRFAITTPTNTLALPMGTQSLPSILLEKGYNTCLIGKWHLGSLSKWGPNHFGFQHSYGSLAGGVSPWSHGYKEGIYRPTWHRNGKLIEQEGHVTDLLTQEAIDWIQSQNDDPFFLYLPYTAVHLPLNEPQQWLDRVSVSVEDQVERHYLASIMHLDDAVGQILDILVERQMDRHTVVVFTSDNGGSAAENNDRRYPDDHCPSGRLPGRNIPLRGMKGDVYEGGIRVPTMVWAPGRFAPRKEDTPVHITDWLPTFCRFAGVRMDTASKLDGFDLHDLLIRELPLQQRGIYTAGPKWRSVALRVGRWKLIEHRKETTAKIELYDLKEDPGEKQDLALERPEVVKRLRAELTEVSSSDRDSVVEL